MLHIQHLDGVFTDSFSLYNSKINDGVNIKTSCMFLLQLFLSLHTLNIFMFCTFFFFLSILIIVSFLFGKAKQNKNQTNTDCTWNYSHPPETVQRKTKEEEVSSWKKREREVARQQTGVWADSWTNRFFFSRLVCWWQKQLFVPFNWIEIDWFKNWNQQQHSSQLVSSSSSSLHLWNCTEASKSQVDDGDQIISCSSWSFEILFLFFINNVWWSVFLFFIHLTLPQCCSPVLFYANAAHRSCRAFKRPHILFFFQIVSFNTSSASLCEIKKLLWNLTEFLHQRVSEPPVMRRPRLAVKKCLRTGRPAVSSEDASSHH